jgi:ABC-type multidrug transport system permease subunit
MERFQPRFGPWLWLLSAHALFGLAPGHAADAPALAATFYGAAAGQERQVLGLKLCWCPAGKFTFGSPPSEPERRPGEKQIPVTLTKGFWMGKYEVTQGEWKRIVGELPGPPTDELPNDDDLPVGNVNFAEAESFCAKLTERAREANAIPAGWEFRLPTEAQWEYACRAGTTTGMQQAGSGANYIRNILNDPIASFLTRTDLSPPPPVNLVVRKLFNPNSVSAWFSSVVAIINQITLLTVVLIGAAVIREREHGALEHLLVMPLKTFEIAMAKVWANGLVIFVATAASLFLIVRMALKVPFAGSYVLWFAGVVLYLFFATALGIFLGTSSRTMAQFALLIILVIVVLQLLSGGSTPVESQPQWLQWITFFLPSRHFVSFSQVIINRGGGIRAVWPQFLMVSSIGLGFFVYSLMLFHKSIAVTK